MDTLLVTPSGTSVRVTINRPEIRNAFNPRLISELTEAFDTISTESRYRVVILEGAGKVFCAGADLNWMQEMAGYTTEQNYADALRLTEMLRTINECSIPVIARVQRAAFGGAIGLLACCDSVICTAECRFAFSEVRLGISPATIAPYVISKLGPSHARDLFLSGQSFDAEHALRIGLVHQLVDEADLDDAVGEKAKELLQAGPAAAAATKKLIRQLGPCFSRDELHKTAELIAELRVSAEGQAGLRAFLEKRSPDWLVDS